MHRFNIGEPVYYQGQFGNGAGFYNVVRRLPVEGDRVLRYRIKKATENFERVAFEEQLTAEA